MNRRWVCASRAACTSSSGRVFMSSHGDSVASGAGRSGVRKISSAHCICIQVVPHFGAVLMMMSSSRSADAVPALPVPDEVRVREPILVRPRPWHPPVSDGGA